MNAIINWQNMKNNFIYRLFIYGVFTDDLFNRSIKPLNKEFTVEKEFEGLACVFMSVEQKNLSQDENDHNSARTYALLKSLGADVTPILGKYKGREEKSLLIINPSQMLVIMLPIIAKKFNQESVMLVSTQNRVNLVFSEEGKKSEYIGRLVVNSNPKAVLNDESYSIDLKRMIAYQVVDDETYNKIEETEEPYKMA